MGCLGTWWGGVCVCVCEGRKMWCRGDADVFCYLFLWGRRIKMMATRQRANSTERDDSGVPFWGWSGWVSALCRTATSSSRFALFIFF